MFLSFILRLVFFQFYGFIGFGWMIFRNLNVFLRSICWILKLTTHLIVALIGLFEFIIRVEGWQVIFQPF